MRIEKRLLVNGNKLPLAGEKVDLGLGRIGEAEFDVLTEINLPPGRTLVELYAGVAGQNEFRVFTGVLTEIRPRGSARQLLRARELSMVLELEQRFNMHRPTPRELIARIEKYTSLNFLLPVGMDYLDQRFIEGLDTCSSVKALELMIKDSGSKDLVWYQMPDGKMFFGHWIHGPYTKNPLPVDAHLLTGRDDKARTLNLPYIPALRPGMVVQADFRFLIEKLRFNESLCSVQWRKV